ncbi:hypothetical protein NC652_025648 [Populus alba x Populus x berolinensis]|nr:hypothetical protein NC652_025645 [Populus alba x Populus x berolinensis]KAJ6899229.1 hypothetical protein NC652_025648 [Populus alba x Populus x berolinensis]
MSVIYIRNNEGTREQPLGLLQPLFTVDNDWGFFSQKLHIKCSSSSQENGQWKITMYPFTVSMDMVQVSNVKIILCFHEEILKMGTSSEILIFRSAVMWLSIFKTIRLLYLMSRRWDELMPARIRERSFKFRSKSAEMVCGQVV